MSVIYPVDEIVEVLPRKEDGELALQLDPVANVIGPLFAQVNFSRLHAENVVPHDVVVDELHKSRAVWNEFANSLKRIGEKITGVTGARSERERAEGYRYLLRLISGAHDLEMEADRRFPMLKRMMTPIRKFKGDGTDTLYHEAKLDENLGSRGPSP